jgi:hypothetical protein
MGVVKIKRYAFQRVAKMPGRTGSRDTALTHVPFVRS